MAYRQPRQGSMSINHDEMKQQMPFSSPSAGFQAEALQLIHQSRTNASEGKKQRNGQMKEQTEIPGQTFADVFGNEITISSHTISVMEAKVRSYLDTHEGAW